MLLHGFLTILDQVVNQISKIGLILQVRQPVDQAGHVLGIATAIVERRTEVHNLQRQSC